MAELLKQVVLKFTGSESADVIGYALFCEPNTNPVTRQSERIDLGKPEPNTDGLLEVVLSDIPSMISKDGVYNLGIAAVDDAGNESALLTDGLQNVALDFKAPDPPTNASVSYV